MKSGTINGYAFTKKEDKVFVVHLESFHHVAVIFHDNIIETNMDEIECQNVLDYYACPARQPRCF